MAPRTPLVVGILKETRPDEFRSPLTPQDVLWLKKRRIDVEVESSSNRIFKGREYKNCGARVVDRFKKATLLVGIKEPRPAELYKDKIYMVFSHTIKGWSKNIPLLNECMEKNVTLVDHEKIKDPYGSRLVYFGRSAGICGTIDSLSYLGKKLEWKGIDNPFSRLKPAHNYKSIIEIKKELATLSRIIIKRGFDKRISPFIIGITGHGHVSQGVNEILAPLNPIEIHPKDIHRFVRHQRHVSNRVYKIVFQREEKLRAKDRHGFYFKEYLYCPKRFESNMDVYLSDLNILINGSYWDRRYPRLVTKEMIHRLYQKRFRLEFIGDISCDVNGSIELNYKTTSIDNPTYTYDPKTREYVDGYKAKGITILARDNLPAELPKDASKEFSGLVREYVYQLAAHGVKDITNHVAIPKEIREAVVIQDKKLTKPYNYLRKFL